jgi:hypothetical protein
LLQRAPEPLAYAGRFAPFFRRGVNSVQHRFHFHCAPETLSLFAMILVMIMFGAAILYEGALLWVPQQTAQLAIPNLNP